MLWISDWSLGSFLKMPLQVIAESKTSFKKITWKKKLQNFIFTVMKNAQKNNFQFLYEMFFCFVLFFYIGYACLQCSLIISVSHTNTAIKVILFYQIYQSDCIIKVFQSHVEMENWKSGIEPPLPARPPDGAFSPEFIH